MALPYSPRPGEVLICRFDEAAVGAEMVKPRPVIVVSRKDSHHGRKLATVVPLSTTEPTPAQPWHHCIGVYEITGWHGSPDPVWAKCDMVATVSFLRLNKPYRNTRHGRQFVEHTLPPQHLDAVRAALRAYLSL
ncbi:type II toxin-antitoxin system PemK/MazF family toxin [Rubrivivax gelatinosus]|uniref:Type II toxin-antitoxin system PemK/MazF family toxin n=1 Tax=Rubrivivax gelatinosus TaxID=28068 RepID=A0ABS1DYP3_RUBGE|nr:type II toxin-antitoxin system PemK/MazF family toxin [Rubrivivax gelatinosus]MBK1714633.1 hypothetical protein [Rubrivivax gelatinosus]